MKHFLSLALLLCLAARAQQPATPPSQAATDSPQPASALLNPSISSLQQALDGIRLEKWKTSNAVRGDTEANIASIRRDLESTLPPLLADADTAPSSVARVLPAYRNIEALYDVLLRVSAVAHLVAPTPQFAALDQAISSLDTSRRTLGDQIQTSSLSQDNKLRTLQASLHAAPQPAPVAVPCTTPAATVHKRKPHPKASTPPQSN
ncbi:MAG: hypothetical protein M3Y50_00465 [Acidobacteriota bacterium]|nr:hypothetical protein [Acidobacteriota bacterium]